MQLNCRWGKGRDTTLRGQAAASPRLAADHLARSKADLVTAEQVPEVRVRTQELQVTAGGGGRKEGRSHRPTGRVVTPVLPAPTSAQAGLRSSATRWQMPAPGGTLRSRMAHEDHNSRVGSYYPTKVSGCSKDQRALLCH